MSDDLLHVKGGKELNEFLQQLPVKLERNVLRGAMRAGAKVVLPVVQAEAPKKTGALEIGIKIKTSARAGRVIARIVLTGKHAFLGKWFEFTGAAPHMIKAKNGGALFFGGHWVESVQHPGFAAKPFMRPALDAQASAAVVAAGNYVKDRLATKHGIDTSDIEVSAEEAT